jgi:hypothetical protein
MRHKTGASTNPNNKRVEDRNRQVMGMNYSKVPIEKYEVGKSESRRTYVMSPDVTIDLKVKLCILKYPVPCISVSIPLLSSEIPFSFPGFLCTQWNQPGEILHNYD